MEILSSPFTIPVIVFVVAAGLIFSPYEITFSDADDIEW